MADADLKLTLDLDATGVVAGAGKAEASVEELAREAKEAFEKANAEVNKLAESSGPQLAKQIGKSTFSVMELKSALERAEAAGVGIGSKTLGGLERMEASLEKASAKAREFSKEQAELRKRGDISAQGMEALSGQLGSVEGWMGLAGASTSKLTAQLGAAGFAVTGAVAGVGALKDALKNLDSGIKAGINAWAEWKQQQDESRQRADLMVTAQLAVQKGLIEQGSSLGGTLEKWKSYQAEVLRGAEVTKEFAKLVGLAVPQSLEALKKQAQDFDIALGNAAKDGQRAFQSYSVENAEAIKKLVERMRIYGEAVPDSLKQAIKASDDYSKAVDRQKQVEDAAKKGQQDKLERLSEIWKKQKEVADQAQQVIETYNKEVAANGQSVEADRKKEESLSEIARKAGLTRDGLDELLKKNKEYEKAVNEATAATGGQARALNDLDPALQKAADDYARLTAAIAAQRDAQAAATNFTSKAPEQFKGIQDAAVGAAVAEGKFGDSVTAVGAVLEKTGGAFQSMTSAAIGLAEATEQDIAAFERLSGSAEGIQKTKDVLGAWEDYVANVLASYRAGFTDIMGVQASLGPLIDNLMKMMNRATGEARQEISRVLTLMQQIRMDPGAQDMSAMWDPMRTTIEQINKNLEETKKKQKDVAESTWDTARAFEDLNRTAGVVAEGFSKVKGAADDATDPVEKMVDRWVVKTTKLADGLIIVRRELEKIKEIEAPKRGSDSGSNDRGGMDPGDFADAIDAARRKGRI